MRYSIASKKKKYWSSSTPTRVAGERVLGEGCEDTSSVAAASAAASQHVWASVPAGLATPGGSAYPHLYPQAGRNPPELAASHRNNRTQPEPAGRLPRFRYAAPNSPARIGPLRARTLGRGTLIGCSTRRPLSRLSRPSSSSKRMISQACAQSAGTLRNAGVLVGQPRFSLLHLTKADPADFSELGKSGLCRTRGVGGKYCFEVVCDERSSDSKAEAPRRLGRVATDSSEEPLRGKPLFQVIWAPGRIVPDSRTCGRAGCIQKRVAPISSHP